MNKRLDKWGISRSSLFPGVTLACEDEIQNKAHKASVFNTEMVLKRKISAHAVCINPKNMNGPKKPTTKADLIVELKLTKDDLKLNKELNDALLEEVKSNEKAIEILKKKEKKHLEAIHTLKLEVANLREGKTSSSSECQTFSEDIRIPCNSCMYNATCEEELNWHMSEEHEVPSDLYFDTDFPCDICGKWCRSESDLEHHQKKHEESLKSADIPCSKDGVTEHACEFCAETFQTKRIVMQHKKELHKDKVNVCWNFPSGKCVFGDNLCWFLHSETSESSKNEIKCNICEKVFANKGEFMHHKRIEHAEIVQMCNNTNSCPYQNCWFRHEPNTRQEQNNEKEEVTEKILSMMEKCTQRIVKLEKMISK